MKKLFVYLKNYKLETVLAPLFKMFEALLELFVPLVVKKIIDVGIMNSDGTYILKMCVLLAFIAFVGLAFSITAQYFSAKAAVGFSSELRYALFSHIGTLSYSEIDTLGTSKLITRMTSDVNQVQNGINLTLRLLLRSPFVVFGAMIMAFTVDSASALTFVGTIPALSVVVFAIMLGTVPLYKAVQKHLDGILSKTRSSLTGVRVLRAFTTEKRDIEDFRAKNLSLLHSQQKAAKFSALLNPLTYVIINIAVIILIYTGALRVEAGIITQGAVVALYNYMSQILVELIKLANLIITITKAFAGGNRISEIFETKPSISYPEKGETPDFSAPAVEFRSVSFTYKNAGAKSLDSVSFTAKKGEQIGIIGSTGSGKSTLINLIPRFYEATEGEIYLFGKKIDSYSKETLEKLISVVAQRAVLFSGTIRENILWGKKDATEEEITAALKTAQAEDIILSKSKGLDERVEEGGKNFSGGQKQRLTIARALIKNAPVLILDDSASALDFATDLRLRQALTELPNSPTVFIVSQRTSSVMNCDKILVMEDGEIEAAGTHEELLRKSAVYKEIHSSLTGGAEK
ncbi:MAG: ABC transporter ATP-binding protein [Ruminococcaceae bacterium]|nr:ABC transporter ATP-binding protein [Oscillospiraceae bacterium]